MFAVTSGKVVSRFNCGVCDGAGRAFVFGVNRLRVLKESVSVVLASMRLDLRGVGYRLCLVFLVAFRM